MDQENTKSTLYTDICTCVLDILDALNDFASKASEEERLRWPLLVPLGQKLVATIEKGNTVRMVHPE